MAMILLFLLLTNIVVAHLITSNDKKIYYSLSLHPTSAKIIISQSMSNGVVMLDFYWRSCLKSYR